MTRERSLSAHTGKCAGELCQKIALNCTMNMTAPSALRSFTMGLSLFAACFLGGCAKQSGEPIRIGINAWPGYEFLYLAQEKGFYKEEGVAVRLVEFNSLSDARRAYERGQIDGLGTTVVEVLQAREYSRRSPQIVQVLDYSDGADMLLTQPGITNGAGLRGKRVGVELASLGVYVLTRALEKHGLKLADIEPVSIDQMTMENQFHSGKLDAVVTYPPTTLKLLRADKAHRFFTTAEIPGEVVDVLAFEAALCRERADDISKVLRAFRKALNYEKKNPDDAHAIMARREGITPAEFREALTDGVKLLRPEDQMDYLKSGGKLTKVIDATDRALREAHQINGPDRREGTANDSFATAGDSRE